MGDFLKASLTHWSASRGVYSKDLKSVSWSEQPFARVWQMSYLLKASPRWSFPFSAGVQDKYLYKIPNCRIVLMLLTVDLLNYLLVCDSLYKQSHWDKSHHIPWNILRFQYIPWYVRVCHCINTIKLFIDGVTLNILIWCYQGLNMFLRHMNCSTWKKIERMSIKF